MTNINIKTVKNWNELCFNEYQTLSLVLDRTIKTLEFQKREKGLTHSLSTVDWPIDRPLKRESANRLMESIENQCSVIVDGTFDASIEIQEIIDHLGDHEFLSIFKADDYFSSLDCDLIGVAEKLGVTDKATKKEIEELASELNSEAEFDDIILVGTEEYLEELKNLLEEAE